jgi:hypothetical protein
MKSLVMSSPRECGTLGWGVTHRHSMRTRRNIARQLALVIPLVLAGCSSLGRKDTNVAQELAGGDGCSERPPAAERSATVMVTRSALGRYPTLNLAVSECFEASESVAVLLSLRVSRQGAVCEKSVRESTGRPAAVSCFLRRFVRWEFPTGTYRLLVDLTARPPTSSGPPGAGGLTRG